MSRLFYNRNHTFNKLFWFFWNYFQDASIPTAENLFLLVVSMLALESFRSVRYAWRHIISRLTGKSPNSFYYTLGSATFDHLSWASVTARLTLGCMPLSLRGSTVFLSIDDTLVEKYGTKFQARSKLFDHAAHNGSSYLNGHCFVSVMLHVPLESDHGIIYLSVPLGYRLWTKELSKLELAADMVRSVMPEHLRLIRMHNCQKLFFHIFFFLCQQNVSACTSCPIALLGSAKRSSPTSCQSVHRNLSH